MNTALKIGLASALALATAMPAAAQQPYRQTEQSQQDQRDYQQKQSDYADQQSQYQNQQNRYQNQQANYQDRREDYANARAAYERRRDDWLRARTDYDRRYGPGTYVRAYGPEPVWDDAYWGPAPAAAAYGANTSYSVPATCRSNNNSAVLGGVIGALAGAALGSNVAARNARTEGAVLGAVVGGGVGVAVGNANDRYNCDSRGPYYSYNDTIAYRESAYDRARRSGRYDYAYYNRQRCRLAAAPVNDRGDQYRYVRVCPDGDGRYRITG
jgi:hypothetical protein